MKKVLCILAAIMMLICSGCTHSNPGNIKRTNKHFLEWNNYATAQELVNDTTHIFEGKIIDIFAEVVDRRTGKAQRKPIGDEDPSHYELVTVYKVHVTRAYKGNTKYIEYILFPGGNWDEMIVQQKQALERAGMYNPDKGIHDISPKRDLQKNTTYLFCVRDWLGDYKAPTSYMHFALEEKSLAAQNYPDCNPNEIKKLLPYVPHPILIFAATSAVVLSILIFLQTRQKKTDSKNS